jgi:hypothetical protein
MGYPLDKSYEDSSNMVHAKNLKGALMLIVGELDTNVDPSSTYQVANALNVAAKDYDLLFVPGGQHGAGSSSYGLRRQRDFFVNHLFNMELPRRNFFGPDVEIDQRTVLDDTESLAEDNDLHFPEIPVSVQHYMSRAGAVEMEQGNSSMSMEANLSPTRR